MGCPGSSARAADSVHIAALLWLGGMDVGYSGEQRSDEGRGIGG